MFISSISPQMQNATNPMVGPNGERRPQTAMETLQNVVAADGLSGLFRGYGPRITQSVLAAAILFLAKERIFNGTQLLILYLQTRKAHKGRKGHKGHKH